MTTRFPGPIPNIHDDGNVDDSPSSYSNADTDNKDNDSSYSNVSSEDYDSERTLDLEDFGVEDEDVGAPLQRMVRIQGEVFVDSGWTSEEEMEEEGYKEGERDGEVGSDGENEDDEKEKALLQALYKACQEARFQHIDSEEELDDMLPGPTTNAVGAGLTTWDSNGVEDEDAEDSDSDVSSVGYDDLDFEGIVDDLFENDSSTSSPNVPYETLTLPHPQRPLTVLRFPPSPSNELVTLLALNDPDNPQLAPWGRKRDPWNPAPRVIGAVDRSNSVSAEDTDISPESNSASNSGTIYLFLNHLVPFDPFDTSLPPPSSSLPLSSSSSPPAPSAPGARIVGPPTPTVAAPTTLPQWIDFIRQILEGLVFLHEKGWVHGGFGSTFPSFDTKARTTSEDTTDTTKTTTSSPLPLFMMDISADPGALESIGSSADGGFYSTSPGLLSFRSGLDQTHTSTPPTPTNGTHDTPPSMKKMKEGNVPFNRSRYPTKYYFANLQKAVRVRVGMSSSTSSSSMRRSRNTRFRKGIVRQDSGLSEVSSVSSSYAPSPTSSVRSSVRSSIASSGSATRSLPTRTPSLSLPISITSSSSPELGRDTTTKEKEQQRPSLRPGQGQNADVVGVKEDNLMTPKPGFTQVMQVMQMPSFIEAGKDVFGQDQKEESAPAPAPAPTHTLTRSQSHSHHARPTRPPTSRKTSGPGLVPSSRQASDPGLGMLRSFSLRGRDRRGAGPGALHGYGIGNGLGTGLSGRKTTPATPRTLPVSPSSYVDRDGDRDRDGLVSSLSRSWSGLTSTEDLGVSVNPQPHSSQFNSNSKPDLKPKSKSHSKSKSKKSKQPKLKANPLFVNDIVELGELLERVVVSSVLGIEEKQKKRLRGESTTYATSTSIPSPFLPSSHSKIPPDVLSLSEILLSLTQSMKSGTISAEEARVKLEAGSKEWMKSLRGGRGWEDDDEEEAYAGDVEGQDNMVSEEVARAKDKDNEKVTGTNIQAEDEDEDEDEDKEPIREDRRPSVIVDLNEDLAGVEHVASATDVKVLQTPPSSLPLLPLVPLPQVSGMGMGFPVLAQAAAAASSLSSSVALTTTSSPPAGTLPLEPNTTNTNSYSRRATLPTLPYAHRSPSLPQVPVSVPNTGASYTGGEFSVRRMGLGMGMRPFLPSQSGGTQTQMQMQMRTRVVSDGSASNYPNSNYYPSSRQRIAGRHGHGHGRDRLLTPPPTPRTGRTPESSVDWGRGRGVNFWGVHLGLDGNVNVNFPVDERMSVSASASTVGMDGGMGTVGIGMDMGGGGEYQARNEAETEVGEEEKR
ncbi:hypothetical protein D9758_012778 [Tetrapyrgos nigripes]|uniref:Uncharacterized protein n=1 Tax=Tetrapyrgos nigripes TaxID=182062 RepID=A0A8H5CSU7_9AGAR|nr:hypothetical protein D9758_012778 [Tetrapyrgos nigripes]